MKAIIHIFFTASLFLIQITTVFASHNRAGEITYAWVSGSTYKATVVTYTKNDSPADRCELEISWGDGDVDTIYRANGPTTGPSPHPPCGGNIGQGELISPDIRMNIYYGLHTYPGPGIYTISMLDPNRNEGIINMDDSYNTPFFVETTLLIGSSSMGLDTNSSPVLLIPPLDNACTGKLFVHNPGAYDPNGDSLSYQLVDCMQSNGMVIAGFNTPSDVSINPITGDLVWDVPPPIINTNLGEDEYNVCFEIIEWREGIIIGRVLRDMQITVKDCQNDPPEISAIDTCVLANITLQDTIIATDANGDNMTLSANGGPFVLNNSPAEFTAISSTSPAKGEFKWETTCDHIRTQPYTVTFKAEDDNPEVSLVGLQTILITIVGPAPENLVTTSFGNSIQLTWDPSSCANAIGYNIYRRNGSYSGTIECPCETGIPQSAGYNLIETLTGHTNTTYTDNENGTGLLHGVDYCYRIVALFPGGAESCASVEVCQQLKKDVPIITHVSVGETNSTAGIDTIRWSKPTEIDTSTIYLGPYHYNIYRSSDFASAAVLVGSTPQSNLLEFADTSFIDNGINTIDDPHSYKIELISGTDTVGQTHIASSVFLTTTGADNVISLSWSENVPWINTTYTIYKYDDILSSYQELTSTTSNTYVDTGLINGKTYCYYIKSSGSYSTTGIISPIVNFSQLICDEPEDLTPPCSPTIVADPDCETYSLTLTWNNPNNTCADDVAQYNLYYTPTYGGDMSFLESFSTANDTTFTYLNTSSIAGCYAVTALDSNLNESIIGDSVCVDNCPIYELPNVFSPDGNYINDKLIPFPYRYIEKIDLKIFDRWGQMVFKTTNPDINWKGNYLNNETKCSEGVYFYVCLVDAIRLNGNQRFELTGFVHLIRGDIKNNN